LPADPVVVERRGAALESSRRRRRPRPAKGHDDLGVVVVAFLVELAVDFDQRPGRHAAHDAVVADELVLAKNSRRRRRRGRRLHHFRDRRPPAALLLRLWRRSLCRRSLLLVLLFLGLARGRFVVVVVSVFQNVVVASYVRKGLVVDVLRDAAARDFDVLDRREGRRRGVARLAQGRRRHDHGVADDLP